MGYLKMDIISLALLFYLTKNGKRVSFLRPNYKTFQTIGLAKSWSQLKVKIGFKNINLGKT